MCGVAGLIHCDGRPADPRMVEAMSRVQAHRGPDGEGAWSEGPVALGHRRLSIIDLSSDASQPMASADGRYLIVYNGELFNFKELRLDLQARGRLFRTSSDTEVVLESYAEWGPACLDRFNGMWGFAIWDRRERVLFCARDRFGVKPLYYWFDGVTFVFASEIKGILAAVPGANRPHAGYLASFIGDGVFGDTDETFFESIRSLPPAHTLVLEQGRVQVRRWWTLDVAACRARHQGDAADQLRQLLADAVRLRLRSDVPVGSCLSGGLDSSSIVALACGLRQEPLASFSSVYDDPECDESFFIDSMARHFALDSHKVRPDGAELPPLMEAMIHHQEMPSSAPGIFSQWKVMALASGRVKVLLDGQGGDELLAGYYPYFGPYLRGIALDSRRRGLAATLGRLRSDYVAIRDLTGQEYERGLPSLLSRGLRSWLFGRPRVRLPRKSVSTDGSLHPAFAEMARRRPCARPPAPRYAEDPLTQDLADALLRTSIPGLLHYEDRSSMAFGIEARTPLLDYRLVEYAMGLPPDQKIRGSVNKSVLREAMRGILPEAVRTRRDKKGYPTPLARWLRSDIREYARELLLSQETRQRRVFQPSVVERHLQEHLCGDRDHSWTIWRWMTVEVWYRHFIDSRRHLPELSTTAAAYDAPATLTLGLVPGEEGATRCESST